MRTKRRVGQKSSETPQNALRKLATANFKIKRKFVCFLPSTTSFIVAFMFSVLVSAVRRGGGEVVPVVVVPGLSENTFC